MVSVDDSQRTIDFLPCKGACPTGRSYHCFPFTIHFWVQRKWLDLSMTMVQSFRNFLLLLRISPSLHKKFQQPLKSLTPILLSLVVRIDFKNAINCSTFLLWTTRTLSSVQNCSPRISLASTGSGIWASRDQYILAHARVVYCLAKHDPPRRNGGQPFTDLTNEWQ